MKSMHGLAVGLVALSAMSAPSLAQDDARPDIVVAVDGLFRTMEPIEGNSTTGSRVHLNIYDQLMGRNYLEDPEGGELAEGLATGWERVSDRVWQFDIRDDVRFHNGETMTAEDVAFSLSQERIWGEDALVPAGTRYTEGFVRVEAVDETTVEIETENPDANLPYRFITPLGYIVPKDYYLEVGVEEFGQNPVGTGPYRVTEFDSSSHITLEAFDDYWGGEPPAASVEFRVVPEFSVRLAGMVSGEFDLMVNVPIDEIPTVEGYDSLEFITRPISNYVMLAYNTLDIPDTGPNPLTDRNLRYAMTAAIDREGLVEALWGDATYAPAPFNFREFTDAYYDPDVEPFIAYDPEQAREYLEQSGYEGEEIVANITRNAYPNFQLAVEYLAEQWNELGINVQLNVVDSWALALQHPFELLNMSMSTAFDGTPTRAIWGFWGPDSARATRESDRSWEPPQEFVAAGESYLAASEPEQKAEHFREMVRIWEEVQPAIMLWRNVANWVVSDDLDWTPINSNRMSFGPGFLSVAEEEAE